MRMVGNGKLEPSLFPRIGKDSIKKKRKMEMGTVLFSKNI